MPRGTLAPWKSNLVGAEKTHTTQMMLNATAMNETTMAKPEGIRAR